jgi:hypothetical protein
MNACCTAAGNRKNAKWAAGAREAVAWAIPSAVLVLMPKCPACFAAYVALWTGLGLSFSTASWLRGALLLACMASFLFLLVKRRGRIAAIARYLINRSLKQETEPCPTKSALASNGSPPASNC